MCRSEEDLFIPLGVCLVARVPTKAIFTLVRVTVYNMINNKSYFVMLYYRNLHNFVKMMRKQLCRWTSKWSDRLNGQQYLNDISQAHPLWWWLVDDVAAEQSVCVSLRNSVFL